MLSRRSLAALALGWLAAPRRAQAQPWTPNYDERKVPRYTLPPILRHADGRTATALTWPQRRHELLDLFEAHVYGRTPGPRLARRSGMVPPSEERGPMAPVMPAARVTVHEAAVPALGGRARRTQLAIGWPDHPEVAPIEVVLYEPAVAAAAVPVFIGLNFFGNHAIHRDPAIRLSDRWMRSSAPAYIHDHRATAESRGAMAHRWPVERILEAGCAVMTAYCGDLAPDDAAEVAGGVAPLFTEANAKVPVAERWGAIGMWAWGLSRICDLTIDLPGLDSRRVAVIGHSRLGKAALWAAAQDERFALVISNESGCGGAALSRRAYGETVGRITDAFPHWFCARFASYAGREADLPVDQHQLLALTAPRMLYVASAIEDRWADPRGEFLAAAATAPVYRLLGRRGLGTDRMPAVNTPIGDHVRYHVRAGGHDLTTYDWQRYLEAMGALPVR